MESLLSFHRRTTIGSNVIIKSTNSGTATDINGAFVIKNHKDFPIEIKISFLGYKSKEVL